MPDEEERFPLPLLPSVEELVVVSEPLLSDEELATPLVLLAPPLDELELDELDPDVEQARQEAIHKHAFTVRALVELMQAA